MFKKDYQTNIDKYRLAANITEYVIWGKLRYINLNPNWIFNWKKKLVEICL